MKKLYIFALLLFAVHLSFAQNTTLELGSFEKLEIFGPFKVNLIKSEKTYAEIDFNGIDKEDVVCEVHKQALKLKLKNGHYVRDWKDGRGSRYVRINVYYTDIDVIEAAAGAIVKSNEPLKSKYLILDGSMGAEIWLDVIAKKIEAISTMGAQLEMRGQTEYLGVIAKSGGTLDARDLESQTTIVKATTGADVFVSASDELDATAGFGASVDYVGGPSVRHTSKNFGGEVNRRDGMIRNRNRR